MKTIPNTFLAALLLIGLTACNSTAIHHAEVNNSTKSVQQCDHTFMVTSNGDALLFEHDDEGMGYHLLRKLDLLDDPFYDCERNQVVGIESHATSTSYFSPNYVNGVTGYDLGTNTYTFHSASEMLPASVQKGWFSSLIRTRYRHGFLVDVDYHNEYNTGTTEDSNLSYVNLDTMKIEHIYGQKGSYSRDNELVSDTLCTRDFHQTDLIKDTQTNLYPEANNSRYLQPKDSIHFSINGTYYLITADASYNASDNESNQTLIQYQKGMLYRVDTGGLTPLLALPSQDIVYANSPDKKSIYIFTLSRKVYRYDIAQNSITQTSTLPVTLSDSYLLQTVGYTANRFVLLFNSSTDKESYTGNQTLILTDYNFTQASNPWPTEMMDADIHTEASIATVDERGIYRLNYKK